jgi:CBS domain-containing protein
MKVREIMTRRVESCQPSTDLAAVAMIMWRNDCGVVPVLGEDGRKAVGVITDRDICVALATRHRRAEEVLVRDVMSGKLHCVAADDDIREALDRMKAERVRRLPVVGADGSLQGIVSINDIILHAGRARGRAHAAISAAGVLEVLQALCEHRGAPAGAREEEMAGV